MIFISHSSKNHALANGIADRLAREQYATFLDLANLHGGDRWEARLHEALAEARALVLCATPAALESSWVRKEVDLAIGREIPVIPCALEHCDQRWHAELQWIDFTNEPRSGYERLFAALERIPGLARTWSRDESPYPGLKPFEARHAPVFFGREVDLAAALQSLSEGTAGRVCAFVGPSGVGKSSFVRAALLPHLQSDAGRFRSLLIAPPMRPRAAPLRALAATLHGCAPSVVGIQGLEAELATPLALHYAILNRTSVEQTCVLLVDQFEEVLSAPAGERDAFCARLREAVAVDDSRLLLLLTLRSDFLTACLEVPGLSDLMRDGLHPLGVLDRAALRRAIVRPAAQAGVPIDSAFVEELLDDAIDGRALPLLTDALARLWPVLRDGEIDRYSTTYRESGRVTGGLGQRADGIYNKTSPSVQSSLQAAILALAEMDEDGRIRRRRVAKQDIPASVHDALEQFVAARLLVGFEEDGIEYLEVAHEALFTSWPLCARLLADAEAHLKLSRRLQHDALEWTKSGERAMYLWTGERLSAAVTMLATPGIAADDAVKKFVAVSTANDRRMREREADLIAARIGAAHERRPVVSLLAASDAVEQYGPTPRLERAIRTALDSFPAISVCRHEGGLISACLDPSGTRVVTCGYDGVIKVFDADTGEQLHSFPAHGRAITTLAVDPRGERILSASRDAHVKIWSLSTGALLVDFTEHRTIVQHAMFDAAGTRVATASRDKTARVFDSRNGGQLFSFEHPDQVNSVDITGDGRWIVTSCSDGRVRVFGLDGYGPSLRYENEGAGPARWHPDRPWMAIAGSAGRIRELGAIETNLFEGAQPTPWPHDGAQLVIKLPPSLAATVVRDVQFDSTGARLLAVCSDAVVRIFDFQDRRTLSDLGAGFEGRRMISELTGHEGDVASARFAPGDAQVLTAAGDGHARLYDVESGLVIRQFRGASDALHTASFNQRGDRVVTASADDFARVYRTRPVRRGAILVEHAAPCTSLAVSATRVCATTNDGFLLVADLDSDARANEFHVHERAIVGVDIAPGGGRAVTQPQYESAKVVDLETGTVLHEARGEEPIRVARFLPNGLLVVVDWSGRARLYDQKYREVGAFGLTGQPQAELDVSPDGASIAMVSLDGRLEIFTATGKRKAARKLGENNQAHHLAYRPDGLQLLCEFGYTVFLLDPITLETQHEFRTKGRSSIRYSHRSGLIVVGSASTPGSVVAFDSNTGVEVARVPLRAGVEDASFSHDDRLVVSGGADRSVRVFDAATGQVLWDVFEHGGMVTRVEFASDDAAIFTASTDGSIRRFTFPSLVNLITEARRVAGRELSDAERRSYGLDKRNVV